MMRGWTKRYVIAAARHSLRTGRKVSIAWGFCSGGILGVGLAAYIAFTSNLFPRVSNNPWKEMGAWIPLCVFVGAGQGLVWAIYFRRVMRAGMTELELLRQEGFCPYCGYDVRQSPNSICSECGRDTGDPLA